MDVCGAFFISKFFFNAIDFLFIFGSSLYGIGVLYSFSEILFFILLFLYTVKLNELDIFSMLLSVDL